jgi:Mn-dependent DtxR family transcriptional regulator
MTPAESKVLEAIDGPMTRQDIAAKLGWKVDSINEYIRNLEVLGCVVQVGLEGRRKIYEPTGKKPNENKTLGFTVFGVRI